MAAVSKVLLFTRCIGSFKGGDEMIPRLYDHDSLGFPNEDTGGIGSLKDCLSCKITEEVNGTYEIELTYPTDGYLADNIKIDKWVYAYYEPAWTDSNSYGDKLKGKMQFFRIYKISRNLHGQMTVYGEHISYLLKDVLVAVDPSKIDRSEAAAKKDGSDMLKPDDSGTTLCGGKLQVKAGADILKRFSTPLFDESIADTNVLPNLYMTQKTYTYSQLPLFPSDKPYTYLSLMSGQEGSIIDKFGGFFIRDNFKLYYIHDVNISKQKNCINLRYGHNLGQATYEIETTDIVGTVIGYIYDQETDTTAYSAPIDVPQTAGISSRHTIYADVSDLYSTVYGYLASAGVKPTQSRVTDCTKTYVNQRIQSGEYSLLPESLTVEPERAYGEDNIKIMLPVNIMLPDYGIQITTSVKSITYDVLKERVESYEIGKKQRKISDYIA